MLALSQQYPQKRAFITGAASGLGAALSLNLARDGWTIAMADMRAEPLADMAAKVKSAGGNPVEYLLNVTDRARYAEVANDVAASLGGVDLVVNNAGVAGGGDMGEFTLEDWDWLMAINLMGVVNGCHFFAPHLKAQGRGHIINTASAAAFSPVPSMAAYCSAKAAVKMLSEVLYNELREAGVRVSVVMPEFFQTNLHERTRGPRTEHARQLITQSKYTADDVAKVVLEQAGAGTLHVLFPLRTSILFRISRWFPHTFLALVRRFARQRREEFEAARQEA